MWYYLVLAILFIGVGVADGITTGFVWQNWLGVGLGTFLLPRAYFEWKTESDERESK